MTEQQPGSSSSGVPDGIADSEPVLGGDGPLSGPAVPDPASDAPVSDPGVPESASNAPGPARASLADLVDQPAKVMRIGTMIKQLLEEVRAAPLDDASRNRLRDIHASSIRELEQGLAPELRDELTRITLPFSEGETPSDAELRIAQAQLVGWLEGVFHGIQTALFAQQMAARAQLEEMRRRALPGGSQQAQQPDFRPGGGQYL